MLFRKEPGSMPTKHLTQQVKKICPGQSRVRTMPTAIANRSSQDEEKKMQAQRSVSPGPLEMHQPPKEEEQSKAHATGRRRDLLKRASASARVMSLAVLLHGLLSG